MPAVELFGFPARQQALPPVLPQRLEQPVAGAPRAFALHRHQRPIHQPQHEVEHILRRNLLARTHRLSRVQREAAREDGQAREQRLLGHVEQAVAPIHRSLQCPLPGQRRATAAGELELIRFGGGIETRWLVARYLLSSRGEKAVLARPRCLFRSEV